MPELIDFYFDFSSPYSYLLSEKIDALAARFGRTVRWRPILLGAIFKAAGSAPLTLQYSPKAAYSILDFDRSARFMGLPYRHPDVFPIASQYAARACYWLEEHQPTAARPFAQAVFRALFVDNTDISPLDTVLEIATRQMLLARRFRTAEGNFLDLFVQVSNDGFHGRDIGLKVSRARVELRFDGGHQKPPV